MGSSGSSVHGDSPGKYTGKLSHSVMSDSLQPRGLYPSRLLHPWDSPGKNTGVGCHFLLQGRILERVVNSLLQRIF